MYTYIRTYRVGAWIEVEYFPHTFKFMNFQMTKMYGNNSTLYGGTKIQTQQPQSTSISRVKGSLTNAGPVSKNQAGCPKGHAVHDS